MKTLYLECNMGAAGDMLMAALLELVPDREDFLRRLNGLNLPGVEVSAEKMEKCGITGTHMKVTVHGDEEESLDEDSDHGHDHGHHHHHHDEDHDHEHHHHHDDDDEDHGHHHHHHDDDEDHGHHHHHDDDDDHGHHHHHDDDDDHGHHHYHDDEHDHDHHHHDHEDGHHHDHHHATVADITALIDTLPVSEKVKQDAKAVYGLIAEAESQVHGHPVSEIHFHEVGTLDAVADVVGVCMLMEEIGADRITASPVHVGSGFVRCMHGVLPVPAPATALILQGVPTYGGQVKGELCTPTGAALLKYFVSSFGDRPVMAADRIGYGMGKKDFERANCVRAFLGESEGELEPVTKLECNLDDMTGEDLAFAMERLFEAGAREVFTQAVGMKKSRSGVLLSVLCPREDADRMAEVIMKHTTTLGIRRMDMTRYALERRIETVETAWGKIRMKHASGMGVEKAKPEFEDLARIARGKGVSIGEIRRSIRG